MSSKSWACVLSKNESATHTIQFYYFSFPVKGTTSPASLLAGTDDTALQNRRKLARRGAVFATRDVREQIKWVEGLMAQADSGPVQTVTSKPGFRRKAKTFVLGSKIIGKASTRYLWQEPDPEFPLRHGKTRGSLAKWKSSVAKIASQSSFLTWAIAQALATPLPSYMRSKGKVAQHFMTESASFNLSGKSSSGKTTVCRVIKGVFGGTQELSPLDFSRRGLEEMAERHNDLPLICDDLENAEEADVRQTVKQINTIISKGSSKQISQHISRESYPRLKWITFAFTSSPRPIDELFSKAEMERSAGQKARLFNIPVPSAKRGGIFDLLEPKGVAAQSVDLIARLETATNKYFGHIGRRFIMYLLEKDRSKFIQRLSDNYVRRTAPDGDGYDRRIARKFAAAFAAAMIARKAKLLPWSSEHIFRSIEYCHFRALASARTPSQRAERMISKLRAKANDVGLFPKGTKIEPIERNRYAGFRARSSGMNVLALRSDKMRKLFGRDLKETIKLLRERKILLEGHGDANTRQLPLPIIIKGKSMSKPRFFVLNLKKLQKYTG